MYSSVYLVYSLTSLLCISNDAWSPSLHFFFSNLLSILFGSAIFFSIRFPVHILQFMQFLFQTCTSFDLCPIKIRFSINASEHSPLSLFHSHPHSLTLSLSFHTPSLPFLYLCVCFAAVCALTFTCQHCVYCYLPIPFSTGLDQMTFRLGKNPNCKK